MYKNGAVHLQENCINANKIYQVRLKVEGTKREKINIGSTEKEK